LLSVRNLRTYFKVDDRDEARPQEAQAGAHQRQELSPIYFPPALWRRGNREDLGGCRNFHQTGIRNTVN